MTETSEKTVEKPTTSAPATPKRDAGGKFVSKAAKWQGNNPEAFWQWVKDVQPKVYHSAGRYEVFQPTPRQKRAINAVLKGSKGDTFKHAMSVLIWPRRHGKSTIMALICLFFFNSRENFTIQLLGNGEAHSRRVQYNTIRHIINHTPALKYKLPEKDMHKYEIHDRKRNNVIQMMTGNLASNVFGDRINLLWVSDFHATPDLDPFNALQATLLDSENSLCLIDSNVDPVDGHVHKLQREAEKDTSIFADHVQYKDTAHYCKAAPPWIDRARAKRIEKTTLPTDFKRDILGQRSDAKNALFSTETIELCQNPYHYPVEDIAALAQGRAYKIGGGLDRSKSLMGSLAGADNTIWTTIMKVADNAGEPEIFVLNQVNVIPNTSKNIKSIILKDHQRYGFDNVVLEDHEVTDLKGWLDDQKIENELINPHSTRQNASFPELHRIAKEGRLHFPKEMGKLASEMQTFTYTQTKAGVYTFGHSQTKFKDDRVYSLNWAIFSLRSAVMNLYSLGNIQCGNRSANRCLCFLMGGDLQLLCAERCPAFQETYELFKLFKQYALDSEMDVTEFFKAYVRVNGAVIYQAA